MTPEDIAKFAMMLNLDIEQGRAKLAERIQKEQEAAVQAERERCAMIAEHAELDSRALIAAAIRARGK